VTETIDYNVNARTLQGSADKLLIWTAPLFRPMRQYLLEDAVNFFQGEKVTSPYTCLPGFSLDI